MADSGRLRGWKYDHGNSLLEAWNDGVLVASFGTGGPTTFPNNLDVEGYAAFGNGSALNGANTLMVDRDFSTPSQGNQIQVLGEITVTAGSSNITSILVNPTLIFTAATTHGIVSALHIVKPVITIGSATATIATTVYIPNAPTEGGSNYAILVDEGTTRLDGTLQLGVAGGTQGLMNIQGVTSGVVTVAVAAAAGTWTMTLPTAVGTAGQQLTDAAADGVTSWAAAGSHRAVKNLKSVWKKAETALAEIVHTPVYKFKYKEDSPGTTGDFDTTYVGPVAEEAPWAMHYQGGIVNPVNTLGYMILGFKALKEENAALKQRVAALEVA